jgi:hypothetical protein
VTRRTRRGPDRTNEPKPSPPDTAARRRWWLVLVVAFAAIVRSANLWWMADHPLTEFQTAWNESDTAIHWEWAGRIRGGDVLGRDTVHPETTWMREIAPIATWEEWQGGSRAFAKAPLYPYVLAGLRAIARDHVTAALVGQMLIGLAGVAVTFLLTDRLFGLAAAIVAGLAAALYGPSLLHETLFVRDCLAAVTSLLLLWALVRCTPDRRARWFVAGLLFALAVLARELTLLFGPLVVLWMVQRLRGDAPALRAALACFVGGVLVGLLPLAARNLAVGVPPWTLSALGGQGFVLGHAPDAVPAGFVVPGSAKAIFLEARGRLGETIRLTLAAYQGDWMRLLYNEAARTAAMVASFEAGDNVSWYYFADRSPLLRLSLRYHVVLAAGLLGWWVARERAQGDARILAYFLLAAFAGLQFTAVVARYRLVPAAVLLVYVGVAADWLVETLRDRRWRQAAVGVGAMTGVLAVSMNLLPESRARGRYRAAEFLIAARAYVDRKEPERAYEEMRTGLLTAYVDPAQPALPEQYLPLVSGLLRVGPTIGRGADTAAVVAHLRRTFHADAHLARLGIVGTTP